jgi:hypothetical protein
MARSCIAGEDDDVRRVLVGHQQPLIAWVKSEVARSFAAAGHMLHEFESSVMIADGEYRDAVIPAVGGIEKPASGIDRDRGRRIRSAKALG